MKFRLLPALLALALPAASFAAAGPTGPVSVDGFTFVRTVGQISEYTLDQNGLQVLLMTDHSAPVVTFMCTYRVGSRNEVTGTTGATHLLEHMMFKGSTNYNEENGKILKKYLETIGAHYNANTWLDRTTYFATLGSNHLEGYIACESDRMRNLLLRDSDRQPEMTVVRNEFEIGENDPTESLDKEIVAAMYVAHPYHHSTIGWRSDIENVPTSKLKEFYDTFYWPNNSTVSIIGDFDPATALGLVMKYYGAIPHSPQPIPEVYTVEPEQTGQRRVIVKRSGQLGVVGVGFKTPAATSPDNAPLQVLASILATGKTSRLYRALTDQTLTTSVYAYDLALRDPFGLFIYANLAPGSTHAQVEKAIMDEIDRLKRDGVTDDEVKAAVNQKLARIAYARDGSAAIAASLVENIASGDWTLYYGFEEALRHVTAADVDRVARHYLDVDHSTVGWFEPIVPAAPANK